jgi:acetyl esterase/lipase
MRPDPAPHPLSPRQKLQLWLLRALGRLLGWLGWIRRRGVAAGVEAQRYGTRRHETLEILHPPRRGETRTPVVFVHGGGWTIGQKEMYTADLDFLRRRGHRVYSLDYPLAPENPFPIPLQSLVHALAWLRGHHEDCERVHLMGDSAGGNLAMMLGLLLTNRERLCELDPDLVTRPLPEIASVVSLYGVYDRLSWIEDPWHVAKLMLHCYGGRGAFESEVGPDLALAPLDLRVTRRPPCLLAVGSRDPLLESARLAEKHLASLDGAFAVRVYDGEHHGFFNMPRREKSQLLRQDIELFLDEV